MIDITSKNLNIRLTAAESITAYLCGGNLQVIFGKNAEMNMSSAVTYIQSGKAEITEAVADCIEAYNINANSKTADFNDNAELKVADFDDNAAKAIAEAQNWAHQSEAAASSMAKRDLSNLTLLGEAKFSAKQDVISDLATIRNGAALGATAVQPGDNISELTNDFGYITSSYHDSEKQDILVSGTNIKTINHQSLLGGGDLTIETPNSRNIGEIVTSTIPLIDAGLHLLDGSLLDGTGVYSDFYDYIASLESIYPQIFADEVGWQSDATNYGACCRFVLNRTNKTVRLPLITKFLEGTTNISDLGALTLAGLPNITGSFSRVMYKTDVPLSLDGAFQTISSGGGGGYSTGSNLGNLSGDFDASRSSSIYGNSSTVQPQSIKVLYYIVIATSTKTDIQVDIDEIATDLNGKADVDLSNCTKPHIVETYQNGNSWYRVWSDGWCEQGGFISSGVGIVTINLLKPYKDTFYSVLITSSADNGSAGHTQHAIHRYGSTNTSYFQTSMCEYYGTTTYTGFWETRGYIS